MTNQTENKSSDPIEEAGIIESPFLKIIRGDQKSYDAVMTPIVTAEAKANFDAWMREATRAKLQLERKGWEELYDDPSDFDVDIMANRKMTIDAIEKKMKVVREIYKDLFLEEMI
jgi:hypothetical protein